MAVWEYDWIDDLEGDLPGTDVETATMSNAALINLKEEGRLKSPTGQGLVVPDKVIVHFPDDAGAQILRANIDDSGDPPLDKGRWTFSGIADLELRGNGWVIHQLDGISVGVDAYQSLMWATVAEDLNRGDTVIPLSAFAPDFSGSTGVTLPLNMDMFTAGYWIVIGSLCIQGFWQGNGNGQPPNWAFNEFCLIVGKDEDNETITILGDGPNGGLKYNHKVTYPLYDDGSNGAFNGATRGGPNQGGPAIVYPLNHQWGTHQLFDGWTLETDALGQPPEFQSYILPKQLQYTVRDCTVNGDDGFSFSQARTTNIIRSPCPDGHFEIDKAITAVNIIDSPTFALNFQSATPDFLQIVGKPARKSEFGQLMGGPKKGLYVDVNCFTPIGFRQGAWAYGMSEQLALVRCKLDHDGNGYNGVLDTGVGDGAQDVYTFPSPGVFRLDVTEHDGVPPTWAVPHNGNSLLGWFCIQGARKSRLFRVNDIQQVGGVGSSSVVDIYTTYPLDVWPDMVADSSSELNIRAHYLPRVIAFDCTDTGTKDLVNWSKPYARGKPAGSYYENTITETEFDGGVFSCDLRGTIVEAVFDVITPYTGAHATLNLLPVALATQKTVQMPDLTEVSWTPSINARIAGRRVITPAGVTGAQSGDSGLTLPDADSWLQGGLFSSLSQTITGGTGPVVQIEIKTDQGIETARVFAFNFNAAA